jgi:hypothetical protein
MLGREMLTSSGNTRREGKAGMGMSESKARATESRRGVCSQRWRRRFALAASALLFALVGVACASTASRPGAAGDAAAGRHTPTRTLAPAAHSSTAVPNPHPTAPVSGTPCPVVTVKPIAGCPICPDVHEAPPNGPLPCPPCGPEPAQAEPCPICPPNATGDPPTPCFTPPPPAPTSPPAQGHPTISICSPTQTQGIICGAGFQADEKVSLTGATRSGAITWQVSADASGHVKTALPPVLCKLLPATLIANGSGGDRSNTLALGPDACLPTV